MLVVAAGIQIVGNIVGRQRIALQCGCRGLPGDCHLAVGGAFYCLKFCHGIGIVLTYKTLHAKERTFAIFVDSESAPHMPSYIDFGVGE